MPDNKKWTLMFYLASDNPLAPGVISQLKAIKAAGFHKQANVIVQFDPYTEDTPTHVFDVNIVKKLKSASGVDIGFRANDSFVHNLVEDKLWGNETDRNGKLIRDRLKKNFAAYNPPTPPNGTNENGHEPGPKKSLKNFLSFCADSYPADHYILFLLGHGVVVGNDVFLFDEHGDEQTLTLGGLKGVLNEFKKKIKTHKGILEMVSFHSCSVSSLEVAYELKDMARFMLASQATTYIGSLPYRQILVRIFNSLQPDGAGVSIDAMLEDIFHYCLHNSKDFLLAGYPYDVCLTHLNGAVDESKAAIDKLSGALIRGITTFKDAILLAHLKAQSFQNDLYTDIIDFCSCLHHQIAATTVGTEDESLRTEILMACKDVIFTIRRNIVLASFAGPEYQYAKGLSIYFPWSTPSDYLMDKYADYTFAKAKPDQKSWFDFLQAYFKTTMRDTIRDEMANRNAGIDPNAPSITRKEGQPEELVEDQLALVYTAAAGQASPYALERPIKVDSTDPMGTCNCASIKNYPRDTRRRRDLKKAQPIPVAQSFVE